MLDTDLLDADAEDSLLSAETEQRLLLEASPGCFLCLLEKLEGDASSEE